ncbi:hypothetical protein D3C86_1550260 [compost metagenome]
MMAIASDRNSYTPGSHSTRAVWQTSAGVKRGKAFRKSLAAWRTPGTGIPMKASSLLRYAFSLVARSSDASSRKRPSISRIHA